MNDQTNQQAVSSNDGFPMKWVSALLLVLILGGGVAAYLLWGAGEKKILPGWADGMPAGQALAEEADKPMLVLFTAGWCPPCQALKKNVLTQASVHEALQAGFVPVQIDLTDQSSSNPNVAVADQYGVQGIPAVMAMTPEGQVVSTFEGARDVAGFTDWLKQVVQQ